MLKKFLKYIKDNKSPNTHRTYSAVLSNFDGWLKDMGSTISKATTDDVGEYLSYNKGWSRASGVTFLQSLKSFANYSFNHIPIGVTQEELRVSLMEQQRLKQIDSFEYPRSLSVNKTSRRRALSMSIPDLEKFFEIASFDDKVVAYILLYFCLRKDELFELSSEKRVRSVDYDVDEATFRVKKRMTHTVKTMYFDERTKQVLLDYEKMTPIVDAGTLNRRLSRYDKRMGYRIYPHLFRHTTITQFRKVLAKLYPDTWEYLIKQIAGHTSKDMTDYYTDPAVFQSELKEAMTKNHWMKEVKIKW